MFRRHWAGLPKDYRYPSTLRGLGFFINGEDEIRSIENPDNYYQYSANKNERVNMRRGFHFELALQDVVYKRLEREGMEKVLLPPGTKPSDPHVSVFETSNPSPSAPTVLILGEPTQPHGILSSRDVHGSCGIENGSVISLVRALHAAIPGARVIIANMGALWWWPKGKRSITVKQAGGLPVRSLMSRGVKYVKGVNDVPGHEDDAAHLKSVFKDVVGEGVERLYVLGLGMAGDTVVQFLDEEKNWKLWGEKVEGMVVTGMPLDARTLKTAGLKDLLEKRTRRYILSPEPLDTPLCPPAGDPSLFFETPGMPCYSSSHDWSVEVIAIKARTSIVDYLKSIAASADPHAFENPEITVLEKKKEVEEEDENGRGELGVISEGEKPLVATYDPELLQMQREWLALEEKGELIDEKAVAEAERAEKEDFMTKEQDLAEEKDEHPVANSADESDPAKEDDHAAKQDGNDAGVRSAAFI